MTGPQVLRLVVTRVGAETGAAEQVEQIAEAHRDLLIQRIQDRLPPPPERPPRRPVTPTSLNIWVLKDVLARSPDGVIREVPVTEIPHLRRLIQAGWLEPHSTGHRHKTAWWQLSEKGRAGIGESSP